VIVVFATDVIDDDDDDDDDNKNNCRLIYKLTCRVLMITSYY